MHTSFGHSEVLGHFTSVPVSTAAVRFIRSKDEELRAAYQRLEELKSSLAEMVSIYWGEGDGIEPAPACIQRAQTALSEEVR